EALRPAAWRGRFRDTADGRTAPQPAAMAHGLRQDEPLSARLAHPAARGMMAKIGLTCAAVLLATTVHIDAQVQTSADDAWAGIARSIPKGSPIRLTVVGRRGGRGTLPCVAADALPITVDGLDLRSARPDVLQVFAASGTHRERHAYIGAALGTIAGS